MFIDTKSKKPKHSGHISSFNPGAPEFWERENMIQSKEVILFKKKKKSFTTNLQSVFSDFMLIGLILLSKAVSTNSKIPSSSNS